MAVTGYDAKKQQLILVRFKKRWFKYCLSYETAVDLQRGTKNYKVV